MQKPLGSCGGTVGSGLTLGVPVSPGPGAAQVVFLVGVAQAGPAAVFWRKGPVLLCTLGQVTNLSQPQLSYLWNKKNNGHLQGHSEY